MYRAVFVLCCVGGVHLLNDDLEVLLHSPQLTVHTLRQLVAAHTHTLTPSLSPTLSHTLSPSPIHSHLYTLPPSLHKFSLCHTLLPFILTLHASILSLLCVLLSFFLIPSSLSQI